MSSITVLQLSQQESEDVTQNGVFRIELDTPQLITEGSIVSVKSVFLDTTAAGAGVITLDKDVDCELQCAMYIQNYALDQKADYAAGENSLRLYPNNVNRPPDEVGDNNLWWLSEATEQAGEYWEISGFNVIPINKTSATKEFGNADITFSYLPLTPGSVKTYFPLHVKNRICKTWQRHNPYTLNIQTQGTATTPVFKLETSQDYLTGQGIESIEFREFEKKITPSAGTTNMTLQTFPFKFTIPQGDYTPTEIVSYMNDQVSNIKKDGFCDEQYDVGSSQAISTKKNWPVMSPFLTTVLKNSRDLYLQGQAQEPVVDIVGLFINAEPNQITEVGGVDVDIAGTKYLTYDIAAMKGNFAAGTGVPKSGYRPPIDKYIGANEVAFGYDQAQNKITIETIHMPIYVNDSSTTTPTVTVVNDAVPGAEYNSTTAIAGEYVKKRGIATRYSGIAFTSMTPDSFWVNQLGFTNTCVTPKYSAKMKYPDSTSAVPDQFNSFIIDAEDGVNITGAYPGLDLGVVHHSKNFSTPVYYDFNGVEENSDGNTLISTSDTTSIFSNRIWNTSLADHGYFLIDVATNFNQNLVGKATTTSNTQSIVSRYYTANSFTSDQGAGSIIYEHRGEPQMLSSFDVRVRNPDRTFVDDHVLGNKNTVFINVEKQLQVQQQQTKSKTK